MTALKPRRGLFVGLVTLDLIYLAEQPPLSNQKLVAADYTLSAGGPATNAAVAFGYLGNAATVLGVVGAHPIAHLITTDLQQWGVAIADLEPTRLEPPPVSSIVVTQTTGERAVISINAAKTQADPAAIPNDLDAVDIVLLDGHQMQVGQAIALQARSRQIPVVIDAGSWKPGFETVLPSAKYVICSANFRPPNCQTTAEVLKYLADLGVSHIAITRGEQAIVYQTPDRIGEIPVPSVTAVDTLGAGDIFHGAFCHFMLQMGFAEALTEAATIAAQSCQFFGTRRWMTQAR